MGSKKNERATKTKILTGALKIFAGLSFEKVTVDDIAKRSKVAKGTIYYHFKSKTEILLTIGKNNFQELSSTVINQCEAQKRYDTKLEQYFFSIGQWSMKNRKFCKLYLANYFDLAPLRKYPLKSIEYGVNLIKEAHPEIDEKILYLILKGFLLGTFRIVIDDNKKDVASACIIASKILTQGVITQK